jgi:hypothetical protein
MMKTRWVVAATAVWALGGCSVDVDTSAGSVPAGSAGVRPYATLPTSSETAASADWNTIPTMYRGRNGLRVRFDCPIDGTNGSVSGTDIYTDDSSVCYSALHFGRIGAAAGGPVVIEIRAGRSSYQGTTRNGIISLGYGAFEGSFIVL